MPRGSFGRRPPPLLRPSILGASLSLGRQLPVGPCSPGSSPLPIRSCRVIWGPCWATISGQLPPSVLRFVQHQQCPGPSGHLLHLQDRLQDWGGRGGHLQLLRGGHALPAGEGGQGPPGGLPRWGWEGPQLLTGCCPRQYLVSLQTEERVQEAFQRHRGQAASYSTHARHQESCLHTARTSFSLPIPLSSAPGFSTNVGEPVGWELPRQPSQGLPSPLSAQLPETCLAPLALSTSLPPFRSVPPVEAPL